MAEFVAIFTVDGVASASIRTAVSLRRIAAYFRTAVSAVDSPSAPASSS